MILHIQDDKSINKQGIEIMMFELKYRTEQLNKTIALSQKPNTHASRKPFHCTVVVVTQKINKS